MTPSSAPSPAAAGEGTAEAAAAYAAGGWAVFPCRVDKRPLVAHGFKDASSDLDVVREWWARWPGASIGAPVPAGMVVVDVDAKVGGFETLAGLEARHGGLPATLTVLTGGGGLHLWFAHPGGELRQGASILGPGVDTRTPGRGYVILPPSGHPSGHPYEWYDPEAAAVPMPGWLAAALRPPTPTRVVVPLRGKGGAYGEAALRGETDRVRAAPEGTRNHTLNAAAFSLGQLVASGHLDRATVEAELDAAAADAGLGERERALTIRSGLNAGMANPRRVGAL